MEAEPTPFAVVLLREARSFLFSDAGRAANNSGERWERRFTVLFIATGLQVLSGCYRSRDPFLMPHEFKKWIIESFRTGRTGFANGCWSLIRRERSKQGSGLA